MALEIDVNVSWHATGLPHFAQSRSHASLERVLTRTPPPALVTANPSVVEAIEACPVRYPRPPSLARRVVRRASRLFRTGR